MSSVENSISRGLIEKGVQMIKQIGWIVIAVMLAVSCLWLTGRTPVQAKEEEDTAQTLEKILKNQEKMMADLEWIKSELNVIRIRVH